MIDHPPRPIRGAGVVAMLIALALVTTGQLARMPIAPGASRPTKVVPPTADHASAGQPAPAASPRPAQTGLPHSRPVRVSIPAIDAVSSLMPLQLKPDRTIQVPPLSNPMQAGWYSLGPSPGEIGPSVILGHVDGYNEPGIFFRLREMQPGDRVVVTREDGLTARFVAYRTEQVPKDDFPTEEVYGRTARPELRLITCGGTFDWQSGNYRDNVIVFAVLAESG
jgi:sortase (surface protein transpeptidase)